MALTEKPVDEAAAKRAEDAEAKRRADDTRTVAERNKDRAAASAVQLELQQAVAARAAALELDDEQAVRDADSTLSGLVGDLKKK